MNNFIQKLILCLCLCLTLIIFQTKGQDSVQQLRLQERLDISNGLAHNGISSLFKDSRGYLWIGTYDGLNRYSGYNIKTYKNRVDDYIFQSNRIRFVCEDGDSRLWIGTDMGITIFDYDNNQYISLDNHSRTRIIKSIQFSSHSQAAICFSEDGQIIIYNMQGEYIDSNDSLQNIVINNVVEHDTDKYLIATSKGLYSYDLKENHTALVANRYWGYITADNEQGCYIAAHSQGIQRVKVIDSNNGYKIKHLSSLEYKNNSINSLKVSNNGTLWLATKVDGVKMLPNYIDNWGDELLEVFGSQRASGFLLSENNIYCSTFDAGLFCYTQDSSPFRSYSNSAIKQPQITIFDQEHVIVRSINSNISMINIASGERSQPPFKVGSEVASGTKIFTRAGDGYLWGICNTSQGDTRLFKIDSNNRVTHITSEKLSKITNGTSNMYASTDITIDDFGRIWAGYNDNLYRITLDHKREEVLQVESIKENPLFEDSNIMSRVRCLYIDPKDSTLWLGTNRNGLFWLDIDKSTPLSQIEIKRYTYKRGEQKDISSNFISDIYRTSQGTLYIGTEQGGLCRANEQNGNITSFDIISESNGLSNNVVKSITEDNSGNIWVTTNIGLNMISGQDGSVIKIFGVEEGLQRADFWYGSFTAPNGKILAATLNGFCLFDPEELTSVDKAPDIHLDQLRIFNQVVEPGEEFDGRVILEHRLANGDYLELKHNQNSFSIDVDAIYQTRSSNHTINYSLIPASDYKRLSPEDYDWITTSAKNGRLLFNGVSWGDYQLLVRASDSNGVMGEPISLEISIKPSPWRSPQAYLIYLVTLLTAIALGVYALMRYQQLKHKLHIEQIAQSNSADKLRYFSNVSHELKTPLSLLLAPVAELRERFRLDRDILKKLNIVKRQSKKMLELIELTYGVEAGDLNLIKLSKVHFLFNDVVADLSQDYEFMAKFDNKIFNIQTPCDLGIIIDADRGMIEKILSNLLSNAFKHTRAGDTVTLRYRYENQTFIFEVIDTGYGIGQEDLPHIFERFYQAKRTNGGNMGGTGIGLTFSKQLVEMHEGTISVESVFGQGTTFTVSLPHSVIDTQADLTPKESTQPSNLDFYASGDLSEIIIPSEYSSSLIYLVEDNIELREFLMETIGRYFKVQGFADGIEMLDAMSEEWPDLIISDVMMPQIDGYELCQRVKKDIMTSHIPVILLTACSTVDEKIKGLNAGADAYIPKPFYPRHVITRIETLLGNRQLLRERFQVSIPLSHGNKESNNSYDKKFMSKLYELFNENLQNEDINLDTLARELGHNRSMFFKKVKAITNTSPYELLKEYRLVRATELLSSGKYNVNEVSLMTGFKNRSHFSRIFKERYNISPSKYLDQMKGE